MIGAQQRAEVRRRSSGGAAGSSGCMWPSLRIIGGEPTQRCRSDAPAAHIAWNS